MVHLPKKPLLNLINSPHLYTYTGAAKKQLVEKNEYQLLKDVGLYGKGLIIINDSVLINRYNDCLKEIGVEPTQLAQFSIDGMGYSPEIAQEKGTTDYLAHGGISNPYAIILTPDQEGLPIYYPYYSFYRDVMSEIFRQFKGQIVDLTLRTAIYIDIDEGFTEISSPHDFLFIEGLLLKFRPIGTIVDATMRQRELVSLLSKEENWAKPELIDELAKSIDEYGDLKFLRVQLRDMPYMDIESFYSCGFGGVYVLRDRNLKKPILVHVDGGVGRRIENDHLEYRFNDPDLYERLIENRLIELRPAYYDKEIYMQRISRLAECLFVNALCAEDENIDIVGMSEAQRVKKAVELIREGKLSPVYDVLLKLVHLSQVKRKAEIKNASEELQKLLMHPHKSIKGSARHVAHRLLIHLQPVDILELYAYARETFFEFYKTWPKNKQRWAVAYLKKYYISRTMQKTKLN